VKNQLKIEKFSTFSVENLDPMRTACEYAFNTVYNMNTHAFLDTIDIVGPGSTVIFRMESKLKLIP
jgi:hypothetical protein